MQPFLLISSPSLVDTTFGRSLILVWQHDETGAVGVVINKVSEESVLTYLPHWSAAIAAPQKVFFGGPVEVDTAIGIGTGSGESVSALLATDLVLVDLEAPQSARASGSVRVFAGYSGWSPGQLEAELEQGAWLVAPFVTNDLLTDRVDDLWLDAVGRLGPEHQFLKNLAASQRVN